MRQSQGKTKGKEIRWEKRGNWFEEWKDQEVNLRKCSHHTLHPIQGGRGLPAVREHPTPPSHREVQADQGTLGVRDRLTRKQANQSVVILLILNISFNLKFKCPPSEVSPDAPLSPFAPG